jgi:hypothetical protein
MGRLRWLRNEVAPDMIVALVLLSFVVMVLLTAPVAFALGVAAAIGLLASGSAPLLVVPQRIFEGADSFVLLAIPLFILAGALMETGGISLRLVNLAKALVGHLRGGLGMVVVVSEGLFSGISGSTVADVSAIGSLMIPPCGVPGSNRIRRSRSSGGLRDGHSRPAVPAHGRDRADRRLVGRGHVLPDSSRRRCSRSPSWR